MEIKKEVKIFTVTRECDARRCGGEMKPTGTVLTSMPPKYPHRCDKCGDEANFKQIYPYQSLEEVDAELVEKDQPMTDDDYVWVATNGYGRPLAAFTSKASVDTFVKREASFERTSLDSIHRFSDGSTNADDETIWELKEYLREFIFNEDQIPQTT